MFTDRQRLTASVLWNFLKEHSAVLLLYGVQRDEKVHLQLMKHFMLCSMLCKALPIETFCNKVEFYSVKFSIFFFSSAVHSFLLEKKHYVESAKAVVKLSVC